MTGFSARSPQVQALLDQAREVQSPPRFEVVTMNMMVNDAEAPAELWLVFQRVPDSAVDAHVVRLSPAAAHALGQFLAGWATSHPPDAPIGDTLSYVDLSDQELPHDDQT